MSASECEKVILVPCTGYILPYEVSTCTLLGIMVITIAQSFNWASSGSELATIAADTPLTPSLCMKNVIPPLWNHAIPKTERQKILYFRRNPSYLTTIWSEFAVSWTENWNLKAARQNDHKHYKIIWSSVYIFSLNKYPNRTLHIRILHRWAPL